MSSLTESTNRQCELRASMILATLRLGKGMTTVGPGNTVIVLARGASITIEDDGRVTVMGPKGTDGPWTDNLEGPTADAFRAHAKATLTKRGLLAGA